MIRTAPPGIKYSPLHDMYNVFVVVYCCVLFGHDTSTAVYIILCEIQQRNNRIEASNFHVVTITTVGTSIRRSTQP